MNKRGIALKNIHSYLVEFTQHIVQLNNSGFFDINKEAENTSINILNAVYGYELRNANSILSANFPAIDLVDKKKGVVIQVTSDPSSEKILYTIESFVSKNLHKKYKELYIYILTKKADYYKATKDKIETLTRSNIDFNIKSNVIDNTIIGKEISNITDLKKILDIESILELEFGKAKNQLLKPKSNKQEKFKFDYRNKLTDFLGREKEVSELKTFINSDLKFSWWVITGKAGSGKSRLALEFANIFDSFGGIWGFLSSNQIETFEWNANYPRPMLLIIDYFQSSHNEVLRLIKNLESKPNYENKFRLLLIERVVSGEWWSKIVDDFYASNSLFRSNPLELQGIQTDLLFLIVEQIIKYEQSTVVVDKDKVVDQLKKLDPLQRPLFAMFAGIALAKGQSITEWNQYDLLSFLINEDLRLTKETFKEYNDVVINKHRHLLAIATVCYGLTGYDIDNIFEMKLSWLPSPDEFDSELYNFISYGSILESKNKWIPEYPMSQPDSSKREVELSPLMPDILGEFFVLKINESDEKFKYRYITKLDEFITLSQKTSFYYYSIFLRRIIQDFPTHNKVLNFLFGDKNSSIDNRGSSGYLLIEAMKSVHFNNIKYLETLFEYTKKLSEFKSNMQDKWKDIDDPDRVYQEACYIMIHKFNNNYQEQEKYYLIAKNNTDNFENSPKEFIDGSIRYDEDSMFSIQEDFDNMHNEEYAKEYIYKRLVTDQRIIHLETLCINYILMGEKAKAEKNLALHYINRLFYLCEKFTDPRIKVETLNTCIDYGTSVTGNFENKINKLFASILQTPPQVGPINIHLEQYNFLLKVVNYEISSNNNFNAYSYFTKYKEYLLSQNPNKNIARILILLSVLAQDVSINFYKININNYGNLFLKEITHIHNAFGGYGMKGNPITEILLKVNEYKNTHSN